MKFSLYIAKRYLFSKKSHQVINIISGVAVAGVALATCQPRPWNSQSLFEHLPLRKRK